MKAGARAGCFDNSNGPEVAKLSVGLTGVRLFGLRIRVCSKQDCLNYLEPGLAMVYLDAKSR